MTPSTDRGREPAVCRLWPVAAWGIAVLSVLPVVWAYGSALWDVSLGDYSAAATETLRAGTLLWNTARVCAGTVVVSLVLGVPLGLTLFRTDVPWRRLWLALAVVSPLVPMPVVAAAWLAAGGLQGWLTPGLKVAFGWIGLDFSIYTIAGAAWIMGTAYAPLVAIISGAAAGLVPRALEEDGLLDASKLKVALRVTLWHAAPGTVVAAVLVLALSAAEMTVTDTLVIRTFTEEVYTELHLSREPSRAVALSAPATLVMAIAIAGVLVWTRGRWRDLYAAQADAGTRRATIRPRGLALGMVILVLGVHPGLPVASLAVKAGGWRMLLESASVAGGELLTSLSVSAGAATLGTIAALPIAIVMRSSGRFAGCVLLWAGFALALPSPIVGIALIQAFNRGGLVGWLYNSEAMLVLAALVRFLPFAALACVPAVSSVSEELEAAAALDGAGPWERLVAIVAPLSIRGLLVAWLLVFVLAMGELGASVLVAPPGRTTLAIRVFTLLHYGVDEALAGICLVLLMVTAAPVLAMLLLARAGSPERCA